MFALMSRKVQATPEFVRAFTIHSGELYLLGVLGY